MYSLCGLIIVFAAILITDHIALRRETTRLRQAIVVTAARTSDKSDTSSGLEQNVHNLQSRLRSVELGLGSLQSNARSVDDHERRISSLEVLLRRLDGRIDGVAGTPSTTISGLEGQIQSLDRKIDQHAKYIREIMGKVGMWLPADLLGR
jgi:chromosome segregation ATPase